MKEKAKEKAEKLTLSFIHVDDRAMKKGSQSAWINKQLAKRCAIICCDEIINFLNRCPSFNKGKKTDEIWAYWQAVKKELIK